MHETGLCDAILTAALRRAHGRPVRKVRVRVAGHPVDPEVINQGFQVAAAGTVAAGATVELVAEPVVARCGDCGHEAPAHDAAVLAACPSCGGVDVQVTGLPGTAAGDGCEAVLEAITFDQADQVKGRPQT